MDATGEHHFPWSNQHRVTSTVSRALGQDVLTAVPGGMAQLFHGLVEIGEGEAGKIWKNAHFTHENVDVLKMFKVEREKSGDFHQNRGNYGS